MGEGNHGSIFSDAFNGKMMILFLVILFIACFIIILFHVFSRCFRSRRSRFRRRRLYHPDTVVTPQGLDLSVMYSIPTFIYVSKTQESSLECAVCLSEFEESETGRTLPDCKHCFHVECIDMWLRTHSDCPICRARVIFQAVESPVEPIESPRERRILIRESEDTGPDLYPSSQNSTTQTDISSSSSSPVVKEVGHGIKQQN